MSTAARGSGLPQIDVPPPPLGWSSWNPLGNYISQSVIDQQADALALLDKSIADKAYRYRYVNIDGGWWLTVNGDRTSSGGFAIDPSLWDNGSLADTVQHIHSDGLLAGAYTDAGKTGCGGQNGSEGHYIPDMTQFASWGFDYVKVDYCGGQAENLDPQEQYSELAQAIQDARYATQHKMLFSLCDWGYTSGPAGFADTGEGPWSWAAGIGDLPRVIWRTSGDITYSVGTTGVASFQEVLDNFHSSIHPQAQHTGFYDDPDMMVAGDNGVDLDPANPVQSQAHVSLWAVDGAPMILGANLVTLEAQASPVLGLLTNEDVIAVDQDRRGLQSLEVAVPAAGVEVWSKLLSGSGRRAVVLLNTTASSVPVTVTAAELGLQASTGLSFYDVWSHGPVASTTKSSLTLTVAPLSARMVTVNGTDQTPTAFGPLSTTGPGRKIFDLNAGAVGKGAKVFAMHGGFNAIDIAYSNPGRSTRYAEMTVAGQTSQNVAFPPTGSSAGTVSVAARLTVSGDNDISFSTQTGLAPKIQSLSLVAGPAPVFAQLYPADAPGNDLSGTAVVSACASCDAGADVGYIGTGGGKSGTLTMNGITVTQPGRYTLLIGYANGSGGNPGTGAPRSATLSLNGGAGVDVTFPVAGRDFDTVGVVPVPVTLHSGSNSVSFANTAAYAPDIVALDVAPLAK